MTLATAAGAALTVDDLDGLLSPLNLGDLAEFEAWANERTIAAAHARVKFLDDNQILTPEDKKTTLTEAWDSTKDGRAFNAVAGSLDGIRRIALLSLKHARPDITDAQVNELVTVANMRVVQNKIDVASGLDDGERPNAQAASANSSSPTPAPTGEKSTAA